MPTAIDLFEKARSHERLEQLQAAREHDLLPYFRVLEGPAGPGGGDGGPRADHARLATTTSASPATRAVKQAARDALERYGTGAHRLALPQRHLPLHLELEREIADWMGTEDALVFTTGYLANTGSHRHAAATPATP